MHRIYRAGFLLMIVIGIFCGNVVNAGPCNGGGRNGSCLAACAAPGDLIAPAAGCAAGESCCAVAPVGGGAGGGMVTVPIHNPVAFNTVETFLSGGILP